MTVTVRKRIMRLGWHRRHLCRRSLSYVKPRISWWARGAPQLSRTIERESVLRSVVVVVRQVADAEVRIVRASNYVRVVEEALRKTPGGNVELEEELGRARDELASATRQREEGEAEQRLADALLQRSFGVREHAEDQLERLTFQKVSLWQHAATYLLYFVMLMNVFVTTFGISGGIHGSVFGGGVVHQMTASSSSPSLPPSTTLLPQSTATLSSTHLFGLLANITSTTPDV